MHEFRQRSASFTARDGRLLVPDEAVKPVGSLHLTIGVLHLRDEEAFKRARRAIDDLNLESYLARGGEGGTARSSIGSNALVIPHFRISSLPLIRKGQESQSPKTYVVHLDPLDPDGRLQGFCNAILEHFREGGLIQQPDPARPHPRDNLTLHATLINVRQRRPSMDPRRQSRGAGYQSLNSDLAEGTPGDFDRDNVKPIDASSILDAFGSWKWAENVELDRVALCRLGCKYEWDEHGEFVDGHYEEVITRPIASEATRRGSLRYALALRGTFPA